MSREVYLKTRGRNSAAVYHLFEDCTQLQKARNYGAHPLDSLDDDTDCCAWCIQRAFLRKEACSRCDVEFHALDLGTLEHEMVEWPCPDQGFHNIVGAGIFKEKLASAGLTVDDLRAAADAVERRGGSGPQLSSTLEKMDADELVTDGGQDNSHARGLAEQLRAAEEDDDLPDWHREKARARREEIERDLEGEDGE